MHPVIRMHAYNYEGFSCYWQALECLVSISLLFPSESDRALGCRGQLRTIWARPSGRCVAYTDSCLRGESSSSSQVTPTFRLVFFATGNTHTFQNSLLYQLPHPPLRIVFFTGTYPSIRIVFLTSNTPTFQIRLFAPGSGNTRGVCRIWEEGG